MSDHDTGSDCCHRFLIESCDVRGQLVRLDRSWLEARARTEYPDTVQVLLGEAFVAATLLAGIVKFSGKMTFQIRGSGPVHLLVVQVTASGRLRGLARWSSEPDSQRPEQAFGSDARLTISIETDDRREPYQGIVPLDGDSLAEVVAGYFSTSEQLPTQLLLSVDGDTAAGMLLQRLPAEQWQSEDEDGFQRATILASTVSGEELRESEVEALLHSLFHEERVRLFSPTDVRFACSCSRQRTDDLLAGLGEVELRDLMSEQDRVEITCEFCDARYHYDAVDILGLISGIASEESGSDHTLH